MTQLETTMAKRAMDREYQGALARTGEVALAELIPEITNPQLIFHQGWISQESGVRLAEAARSGVITAQEHSDVLMSHIIFSGRKEKGARTDILVQARIRTEPIDIAKVRRRAAILRRVTNVPTLPVLITIHPTKQDMELAEGKYLIAQDRHWAEPIPDPREQQEQAQVKLIAFDPGGEFISLWAADLAR